AGVVSDRLFAIGPLTKGAHWEITAVPDIRSQCCDLGRVLATRLVCLRRRPSGPESAGLVSPRMPREATSQGESPGWEKKNLFPGRILRLWTKIFSIEQPALHCRVRIGDVLHTAGER